MKLTGNTIFIPGGGSGIGLALALRLKDRGNTVIVGGRRESVLERLAVDHRLETIVLDTTDSDSVIEARDELLRRHPELNVLIAMAGIMRTEDVTADGFLAEASGIVNTNIMGPLHLIDAFMPQLQSQPTATLMTVSSALAFYPWAATPTYNGTKAFIHQFTKSIRQQLEKTSVQVMELIPPGVQTELLEGGSNNSSYVPLDDFADEVMTILETNPDVTEILVEQVANLRSRL